MADTDAGMGVNDPELALAGNEDSRPEPGLGEKMGQRWVFIRRIYMILAIQLLSTVGLAGVVVFEPTIRADLRMIRTAHKVPGTVVYIFALVVPFIILWVLHAHRNHHPQNLVLLMLFTVAKAVAIGLSCSFSQGRIILLALILSSVAVVTLLLYTFCAEKNAYDINSFLSPFMRSAFPSVLILFAFIQVVFPLGEMKSTVFGCLVAIIISSFVIYDTEKLIRNFGDDEYIAASVSIYLDIIKLFLDKLNAGGVNGNAGGDEGPAGGARN